MFHLSIHPSSNPSPIPYYSFHHPQHFRERSYVESIMITDHDDLITINQSLKITSVLAVIRLTSLITLMITSRKREGKWKMNCSDYYENLDESDKLLICLSRISSSIPIVPLLFLTHKHTGSWGRVVPARNSNSLTTFQSSALSI